MVHMVQNHKQLTRKEADMAKVKKQTQAKTTDRRTGAKKNTPQKSAEREGKEIEL